MRELRKLYTVVYRLEFVDWMIENVEWGADVIADSPDDALEVSLEAAMQFAAGLEIDRAVILTLKERMEVYV